MGALTSAIPGFGGLNNQASDLIKQLMAGQLTTGTKNAIYDAGAERATLGGMPGSTGMGGSLLANADLRNIGRAADDQQQRGFQDLLSMLTGYSGTVAPSAGQEQQNDQFNKSLGFNQQQYWRSQQQQEQDKIDSQPKKIGSYDYSYATAAGGPGGGFTTKRSFVDRYLNPKTGGTFESEVGGTPGITPRLLQRK